MRKSKKLISIILVVFILISISMATTVSVSAAGSVTVSTHAQLEAALNDPNIDIIIISQNITLTEPLYINRSVKFIAIGTKTLISNVGYRHFAIQSSNINVSFNNVILDGNNQSGGIYCGDTSANVILDNPYIQNCSFTAVELRGFGGHTIIGGTLKNNGRAIDAHVDLDLYAVTIEGNKQGISISYSTLNVYSSVFKDNIGVNFYGGAIGTISGGSYGPRSYVNIYDSEFYNNTAFFGGAIYNTGDLYIYNTTFDGNIGENDGGAIYNHSIPVPEAIINNCAFTNNVSKNGNGGAYYGNNSRGLFYDCTFSSNRSKLDGGAIYDHSLNLNSIKIDNTIFSNNYSEAGGYYLYLPTDITLYNNLVFASTASAPFYYAFNNYDISYTRGIKI